MTVFGDLLSITLKEFLSTVIELIRAVVLETRKWLPFLPFLCSSPSKSDTLADAIQRSLHIVLS